MTLQISVTVETLEAAFKTLRHYVHKSGADASLLSMTASHIIADADANTVTFIGNNPSQKLSFVVDDVEVGASGEALVSVTDLLAALSTIKDKTASVDVSIVDSDLHVKSKRGHVTVPVLNITTAAVRPKAPRLAAGDRLALELDATALPGLFARAVPGTVNSKFPKLMMWVDGSELCFMGISSQGASFASAAGAKATGVDDIVLWDTANFKRIVDLAASADTVHIAHDSNAKGDAESHLTITVTSKDATFVIEQTMEILLDNYTKGRGGLIAKTRKVLDAAVTTVTMRTSELQRAMESAEKIRNIGRDSDRAGSTITNFDIDDSLLTVSLPDESFTESIDSAKTEGELPRSLQMNAPVTLSLLASLGPESKVTLHIPADDGSDRPTFAIVTSDDTNLATPVKSLPASGYWGVVSLRLVKR